MAASTDKDLHRLIGESQTFSLSDAGAFLCGPEFRLTVHLASLPRPYWFKLGFRCNFRELQIEANCCTAHAVSILNGAADE